ncbi:MAG: MurT ligase domain-containing protein [Oscillospiraceae bacterium]|jgi:ssDNA-binding Zn-finger/Zn-ribbon topoisomerase 1|nr:MurT ligase domain-containing protein [Oscillospiraceae bacterium]
MRILGKNATYLPGKIALKLCPDFLRRVGKPPKIVAVTGTNGKTTSSNLLGDVLKLEGRRVLGNRLGSNVPAGVASCLLMGVNPLGRSRFDIAVLEIDERSAHKILPQLQPDLMVITNLFRDSIMRNAHPEYIATFLEKAIPNGTKLLLNADDLLSARTKQENPRVYFGIERMETDVIECVNLINDMRLCPECGAELQYDYRRYHHIGRAHCPECDFASPQYDYAASKIDCAAMTMTVLDKLGAGEYTLMSDSVFNIYNELTAITALRELGFAHEKIAARLRECGIVESRFNRESVGNIDVVMQMSKDKNALAGSRVFDYVAGLPGEKELILMMNCLHDQKHWSENVCWLYDCDFEFLARDNIRRIVATGPRAKDYTLRLLLAGVPEERVRCVPNEIDAPDALDYAPETDVYIFYGTDAIDLAYRVRDKTKSLAAQAIAGVTE